MSWIDAVNAAHPRSHNDHHLPWVLRPVPPGVRRALDVGCGTGTLLRALADLVPVADGIDRDERVAALAGARVAGLVVVGCYRAIRRRLFWRYPLVWTAPG